MREEINKSNDYLKIKRDLSVAKRAIIIAFVFFIILLGSNKYTELTVAENYEKSITIMKIQTEAILAESGLEWNDFEIVESK